MVLGPQGGRKGVLGGFQVLPVGGGLVGVGVGVRGGCTVYTNALYGSSGVRWHWRWHCRGGGRGGEGSGGD